MILEKWKQIVGNLLGNAIKFTPHGEKIFVSLSKSASLPKTIELTVTDCGIGMTDEIKQNLFKPEDSIRRRGTNGEESTGPGMRIVKKNVDLLRGFIHVDSAPDKGSSITVNIPI